MRELVRATERGDPSAGCVTKAHRLARQAMLPSALITIALELVSY